MPLVDDYDARVADAVNYFWVKLLEKKSERVDRAVKWAFLDRGDEVGVNKAKQRVEKEITDAIV